MEAGRQDGHRLLNAVDQFDCNVIFNGQFWHLLQLKTEQLSRHHGFICPFTSNGFLPGGITQKVACSRLAGQYED